MPKSTEQHVTEAHVHFAQVGEGYSSAQAETLAQFSAGIERLSILSDEPDNEPIQERIYSKELLLDQIANKSDEIASLLQLQDTLVEEAGRQGVGYAEIANALEVSPQAVYQRMARRAIQAVNTTGESNA